MLGKWKHTKTKAFHYRCENERNGKLEPISQDAFGSPGTYHSQRFIYQHKEASDFHRIVMVVSDNKMGMLPLIFIQYYFDGAEHAVAPTLTYHETRRNAEQTPYVRSNKSVIEKLKESDNLRSPKAVQVQSFKEAGGYEDSRASSSFVRNRKQVSNVQAAKQKLLNEDLLDIVDMCTEQKRDPDSAFIRNVTVAPEKTVFLANNRQLNDLVRFCTKDGNVSVLGIDQTFNVGNFYVTLTTYHHLMLKKKRGSNECPVFLGPTLIHHQKTFESFFELPANILRFQPDAAKLKAFGTDSEINLYKPWETLLPKSHHLLCDLHMKENVQSKLTKLGITREIAKTFMTDVFGKEVGDEREPGLVDSWDEDELEAKLHSFKYIWESRHQGGAAFFQYMLTKKLPVMKSCMTAEVRSIAGLGYPPKPYTQNANECLNNVLKTRQQERS